MVVKQADNVPVPGDSIVMETFSGYNMPGGNGCCEVWDFSDVLPAGKILTLYQSSHNDSCVSAIDDTSIRTFRYSNDSLHLVREETSLWYVDYSKPQMAMVYPMSYGDSVQADFYGRGMYCGQQHIWRQGTIAVMADGTGVIINEHNDTLRNVLRLHSIITAAIGIVNDSCDIDKDSQQEITELYQWYIPGYRYPVYEYITTTGYLGLTPLSTLKRARKSNYCIMESECGNDDEYDDEASTQEQSFLYGVRIQQNNIVISYELDAPAHIQFAIADVMGFLHRHGSCNSVSGHHQFTLDCTGLKRGQYILYINVNGTVYNSKVALQ